MRCKFNYGCINSEICKNPAPFYSNCSPEQVKDLLFPMLSNEQRRKLEQDWELDFSYGIKGLSRFRVNFYRDKGNYAAAFRTITDTVPKFEDLGLPDIVRKTA